MGAVEILIIVLAVLAVLTFAIVRAINRLKGKPSGECSCCSHAKECQKAKECSCHSCEQPDMDTLRKQYAERKANQNQNAQ